MKYIRTKDGVYKVVTAERGSDNKLLYIISTSKTENTTDWVHEAGILKQSDTIEELCDEFVIDNPNSWNSSKKPFVYENGRQKLFEERKIKFRNEHNIIVYGAIWTDKGLIYVAKMNEDGELELI